MKSLFLLDAMALIYRSFFAFQKTPRITSSGLNTSAAFGFTSFLIDLIKKERPSHLAVCIDSQKPTFRHEEYEQYKATRSKMPEEIASNIPFIKSILSAMNIPLIECAGYEADDIIGTLSKKGSEQNYNVFMVTPDKDLGQLVNDRVSMYKPAHGKTPAEILGPKEICEKFGIKSPVQMIDYLGLVGDSSDNIPGVSGVGPVAAKKLLDQFNDIETIISNTDSIKNQALKTKIENCKEQAILSKYLATIITDVPCNCNIDSFEIKTPDFDKLKVIFSELEFKTLAQRIVTGISLDHNKDADRTDLFPQKAINAATSQVYTETTPDYNAPTLFDTSFNTIDSTLHYYHLISSPEEIENLLTLLLPQKFIAFDTETTGLDANNCELVGFSFSFKPHEAYYVACPCNFNSTHNIIAKFKPVFEDKNKVIIGHNIKFDILVLKWYDIEIYANLFDTMIAHYIINPESKHSMDYTSQVYLNYDPVPIENLIGNKNNSQISMRDVPIGIIKDYAAEDADVTFQVYHKLTPELEKVGGTKLFETVEMPLIKVLADMEFEGVKIDVNILNDFAEQLKKEIHETEATIYAYAGSSFNIGSPKQLGEILFDKLQIIAKPKKTKTGQYATGEDILLKLQYVHPIIEQILNYRSLSKLVSTYIEPLPQLINPRTGRIHTTFNQAVVATGRLSSNNPNLQNIPVRTERGREIRKAFVPRTKNSLIVSADYSQIELRIMAHISGDINMQNAFKLGKDIHTATAAAVYNVDEAFVTPEMRRTAKTVNFGIIYGISAFGLSERLHISRKHSVELINQYFENYPGIKKYMTEIVEFAKENGFVETILGRKRYINDILSKNATVRGYAERNAINAPIQGSSADMIKIAMINVQNEIQQLNLQSKMILQVHDELVFDACESEVDQLKKILIEKMTNALKLDVPIEVSVGVGKNWLEAH